MVESGKLILKREETGFVAGYGICDVAHQEVDGLTELLHANEVAVMSDYKHQTRKESYFGGRLACKLALGEITDQDARSIDIGRGVFDFPVVKGIIMGSLQVSIAHCKKVAVALAFPEAHPLGVDIEFVSSENHAAIDSQLTASERKMTTDEKEEDAAQHMIWSMKEALSKVLKTGLMINFKLLEVADYEKAAIFHTANFKHHHQYKSIGFGVGNFVCTMVMPRKTSCDIEDFYNSLRKVLVNA